MSAGRLVARVQILLQKIYEKENFRGKIGISKHMTELHLGVDMGPLFI